MTNNAVSDSIAASARFKRAVKDPGPRTTSDPFILRVEHSRICDGQPIGNPAEPDEPEVVPTEITRAIDGLDTGDEVRAFLRRETDLGPRQFVIDRANRRLATLREDRTDA